MRSSMHFPGCFDGPARHHGFEPTRPLRRDRPPLSSCRQGRLCRLNSGEIEVRARRAFKKAAYSPVQSRLINPVARTVAQTVAAVIENDTSATAREMQSRTPSSSR
jgi:hypothetical protein